MVEMTTFSLYTFLIAFILTLHYVRSGRFYLTSADDLCPNVTLDQYDGSSEGSTPDMPEPECLIITLQEFVTNRSVDLSLVGDDVVMEFGPGNHTMESAPLFISDSLTLSHLL